MKFYFRTEIQLFTFGLCIYLFASVSYVNAQSANLELNYLFDMGTLASPQVVGFTLITENSSYVKDRGYGWIVAPEESYYQENKKLKFSFLEDGVVTSSQTMFRVDCPNGEYFLTISVGSVSGQDTKVSVFVNDDLFCKDLKLPWLRLDYRSLRKKVTVTNDSLIIEIHPHGTQYTIRALEIRPVLPVRPIDLNTPLNRDTTVISNVARELKKQIAQQPKNLSAVNQLNVIEKFLMAGYYYDIGWWSWAVEETGLSIFNRFHIASDLLRQIIADKEDPLYELSLFLLGKIHYWLYEEQHRPSDKEAYENFFGQLIGKYPEHRTLRMYLGEKIPHHSDCTQVNSDAPIWARKQHDAMCRILEIIHWWVENRQAENGEMGGKYGDDVEMLRWWLPAILGTDDQKALLGYKRLVEGVWKSGKLKNGFSRKIEDVEHSAELFSDTHPAMLIIDYGNPEYVERCMQSMQNFENTWTGITPLGHRHFKSCYLSADEVIEKAPVAVDVAMNARAMIAGLWLAWYNQNPQLLKTMEEWGDAWVADAKRTDKGKPKGVLPAAVRYDNDEIGGYSDNWFNPNLGWDYYHWKYLGSVMEMYNQLLGLYAVNGKKTYLYPLNETHRLVMDKNISIQSDTVKEGSVAWVKAVLTNQIAEPLTNFRDYPQLLGRAKKILETDQFDNYLSDHGMLYTKYLITGKKSNLIKGCQNIIDDIKYNFPLRTNEVKFTDRVYVRNADELLGMYTGGIGYGKEFPSMAITWKNTGADVATLVTKSTSNQLKILLYNFAAEKDVQLFIWRLDKGTYVCRTGIDQKNNDLIDHLLTEKEFSITERGETIDLTIPSQELVVVEVNQETKFKRGDNLYPDLAMSSNDIMISPGILKINQMTEVHIRIHNIGSKQAEHFRIELSVDGEKIGSQEIDVLEEPFDLIPRMIDIPFKWQVKSGKHVLIAEVIYDGSEITKRNNHTTQVIDIR